MKKRDNISSYIKKELNQRELNPSHDSWNRIQARMDAVPKQKKVNFRWWLSVAAVFVVILSTSVYLFIDKNNRNIPESDFVKNKVIIDSTTKYSKGKELSESNALTANKKNKIELSEPVIGVKEKNRKITAELTKIEIKKDSLINKNSSKSIIEKENELIAKNKLDTVMNTKKETNYTDPNMLLYSIENKENIKESNKSRVVSIDLKK